MLFIYCQKNKNIKTEATTLDFCSKISQQESKHCIILYTNRLIYRVSIGIPYYCRLILLLHAYYKDRTETFCLKIILFMPTVIVETTLYLQRKPTDKTSTKCKIKKKYFSKLYNNNIMFDV